MLTVISSSHEEDVWEISEGILLGTHFQHFIPKVAELETTKDMLRSSPPHTDVHLEEVDLTYLHDRVGSSPGAGSSQYQSPPYTERHMTAFYYRKRRSRPSQLDRVREEDEH